jgi:hypothetical protein
MIAISTRVSFRWERLGSKSWLAPFGHVELASEFMNDFPFYFHCMFETKHLFEQLNFLSFFSSGVRP